MGDRLLESVKQNGKSKPSFRNIWPIVQNSAILRVLVKQKATQKLRHMHPLVKHFGSRHFDTLPLKEYFLGQMKRNFVNIVHPLNSFCEMVQFGKGQTYKLNYKQHP